MEMEYKKILLHKGLQELSDYQFRAVKCLLASELGLTMKMRDEYDRIRITDLMFAKFPGVECVDKLIDTIKGDAALQDLVSSLRKEKQKVTKNLKTAKKKQQQDGAGPSASTSTTRGPGALQGAAAASVAQKRKTVTKEKTSMKREKVDQEPGKPPCAVGATPSRTQVGTGNFSPAAVSFSPATASFSLAAASFSPAATSFSLATASFQPDTPRKASAIPSVPPTIPSSVSTGPSTPSTVSTSAAAMGAANKRAPEDVPLTVMVLERSQCFTYESRGQGPASMFHATVVTASQPFQVKVFNAGLWELFKKSSFLAISGQVERREFLEVNYSSSVSPAPAQIQVPSSVLKRAREPPKIDDIRKFASGTSVYGLFQLSKKTENRNNTIYDIDDGTGSIHVMGSGQWHRLSCEPGDKLQLFCLRLRTVKQIPTLTCEEHSLIQVVKARKNKVKENKNPSGQVNVAMQV